MNYPDDFNGRAFDAAQGTSDDDQAEIAAIANAVAIMKIAMHALYSAEASNTYLTEACHNAGEALEQWIGNIEVHLP
jgi:hypothetical protein